MKKWISLLVFFAAIVFLTGCGSENTTSVRTGSQSGGVNEVLEAGISEAEREAEGKEETAVESATETKTDTREGKEAAETEAGNKMPASQTGEEGIDVDLTALSSTMVYSEVYQMMIAPEDYIGKTVKMSGLFALYHDEAQDKNYYACIIQDATACCAQGIEFVLTEDYVYPDDYPEPGGEICVSGVFDTYREGEGIYCTLRNARLA